MQTSCTTKTRTPNRSTTRTCCNPKYPMWFVIYGRRTRIWQVSDLEKAITLATYLGTAGHWAVQYKVSPGLALLSIFWLAPYHSTIILTTTYLSTTFLWHLWHTCIYETYMTSMTYRQYRPDPDHLHRGVLQLWSARDRALHTGREGAGDHHFDADYRRSREGASSEDRHGLLSFG